MTRTRERLPSPGIVKEDMDRIRKLASMLDAQAVLVTRMFAELYDAALSPTTAGDGIQPGKTNVRPVNDVTGEVAISGMHRHLRNQASNVSRKLRRVLPILDEAEDLIVSAFSQLDPEFRAKWLRLLKELEDA